MGLEHEEISILKADAEQCNAFYNSFAAQTCPHVLMSSCPHETDERKLQLVINMFCH